MKVIPDWSRLRQARLFVATPLYEGGCRGEFTTSMMQTLHLFTQYGLFLHYKPWPGESLVPRARNRLAHKFLYSRTDRSYTHLLFKDADQSFAAEDVLNMLVLDLPVVGALYAKKQINWQRVAEAAKAGVPAEKLHLVAADFVCNFLSKQLKLDEPNEVRHVGNGSMMIRRDVLEKMVQEMPEIAYDPSEDERGLLEPDSPGVFHDFFGCGPDPDALLGQGKAYLSEDWFFCNRARKLGYKIWLCPWMRVSHFGNYEYITDLKTVSEYGLLL